MQFETFEYWIDGAYLSAIYNGDYSGLTDSDERDLDAFLDNIPRGNGHWSGADEDTRSFRRDDVSGLFGDCYKCYWHIPARN